MYFENIHKKILNLLKENREFFKDKVVACFVTCLAGKAGEMYLKDFKENLGKNNSSETEI